jgi:hypothetical protein
MTRGHGIGLALGVAVVAMLVAVLLGGCGSGDSEEPEDVTKHNFDGSRKIILNLIPGESDADKGLFFRIYRDRFAELAGISSGEVEDLMPASHRDWSYIANSDPEWEGFEGFMASREEIDRLVGALSHAAA